MLVEILDLDLEDIKLSKSDERRKREAKEKERVPYLHKELTG